MILKIENKEIEIFPTNDQIDRALLIALSQRSEEESVETCILNVVLFDKIKESVEKDVSYCLQSPQNVYNAKQNIGLFGQIKVEGLCIS